MKNIKKKKIKTQNKEVKQIIILILDKLYTSLFYIYIYCLFMLFDIIKKVMITKEKLLLAVTPVSFIGPELAPTMDQIQKVLNINYGIGSKEEYCHFVKEKNFHRQRLDYYVEAIRINIEQTLRTQRILSSEEKAKFQKKVNEWIEDDAYLSSEYHKIIINDTYASTHIKYWINGFIEHSAEAHWLYRVMPKVRPWPWLENNLINVVPPINSRGRNIITEHWYKESERRLGIDSTRDETVAQHSMLGPFLPNDFSTPRLIINGRQDQFDITGIMDTSTDGSSTPPLGGHHWAKWYLENELIPSMTATPDIDSSTDPVESKRDTNTYELLHPRPRSLSIREALAHWSQKDPTINRKRNKEFKSFITETEGPGYVIHTGDDNGPRINLWEEDPYGERIPLRAEREWESLITETEGPGYVIHTGDDNGPRINLWEEDPYGERIPLRTERDKMEIEVIFGNSEIGSNSDSFSIGSSEPILNEPYLITSDLYTTGEPDFNEPLLYDSENEEEELLSDEEITESDEEIAESDEGMGELDEGIREELFFGLEDLNEGLGESDLDQEWRESDLDQRLGEFDSDQGWRESDWYEEEIAEELFFFKEESDKEEETYEWMADESIIEENEDVESSNDSLFTTGSGVLYDGPLLMDENMDISKNEEARNPKRLWDLFSRRSSYSNESKKDFIQEEVKNSTYWKRNIPDTNNSWHRVDSNVDFDGFPDAIRMQPLFGGPNNSNYFDKYIDFRVFTDREKKKIRHQELMQEGWVPEPWADEGRMMTPDDIQGGEKNYTVPESLREDIVEPQWLALYDKAKIQEPEKVKYNKYDGFRYWGQKAEYFDVGQGSKQWPQPPLAFDPMAMELSKSNSSKDVNPESNYENELDIKIKKVGPLQKIPDDPNFLEYERRRLRRKEKTVEEIDPEESIGHRYRYVNPTIHEESNQGLKKNPTEYTYDVGVRRKGKRRKNILNDDYFLEPEFIPDIEDPGLSNPNYLGPDNGDPGPSDWYERRYSYRIKALDSSKADPDKKNSGQGLFSDMSSIDWDLYAKEFEKKEYLKANLDKGYDISFEDGGPLEFEELTDKEDRTVAEKQAVLAMLKKAKRKAKRSVEHEYWNKMSFKGMQSEAVAAKHGGYKKSKLKSFIPKEPVVPDKDCDYLKIWYDMKESERPREDDLFKYLSYRHEREMSRSAKIKLYKKDYNFPKEYMEVVEKSLELSTSTSSLENSATSISGWQWKLSTNDWTWSFAPVSSRLSQRSKGKEIEIDENILKDNVDEKKVPEPENSVEIGKQILGKRVRSDYPGRRVLLRRFLSKKKADGSHNQEIEIKGLNDKMEEMSKSPSPGPSDTSFNENGSIQIITQRDINISFNDIFGEYIYMNISLMMLLLVSILTFGLLMYNLLWDDKLPIRSRKWKRSDVPLAWGLYFQDGASPSFEGIVDLHNRIMFYLIIILFGVSWILVSVMWNYNDKSNKLVYKYLNHGTLIELIWTVGPALVLVAIAFPSFKLLYLMDEVIDPAMTIKVTGLFGQKLYILHKIINANFFIGEKNMNINYFHTNNIRAKNRIGPHDQDVIYVIIGSLLGHGYCNKKTIEGCRIYFRQSSIHKDYLIWLYEFFYTKGYCSNLKPRLYRRRLNYMVHTGYEFNTYTFRSFNWIHKLFYHKGKKVISRNIENYITPLSLAIWIMDDGGWTKYGVRLSTNAFSYDEIIILTDILRRKFRLEVTIQKLSKPKVQNKCEEKYSIYIKSISIPILIKTVRPYIHPSMLYKIGINN
jgi:hypothetical protein